MSVTSEADWNGLFRIGKIVGLILKEMQNQVQAGMTTRELDAIALRELNKHGARSSPQHVYGFPGASCISINDEAVHGVPSDRKIKIGDVVKIDITADLDGYVADAARTIVIEGGNQYRARLAICAESAFRKAMEVARAGNRVRWIGREVEREVHRHGFTVIRELTGHGVGRTIHEHPNIPNYDEPRCSQRLTPGLVITVEPIIAAGLGRTVQMKDGWTLRTVDGSISAHHEETIIVTDGEPVILTAA